jgi:hypoxanthine phosphoribosyltransferase
MRGRNPLFVCVLNGAFMFASDLIKRLDFPCEVTFIRLKSYEGIGTEGLVKEIHGLVEPVTGRNVVVVEDIVDTGYTISQLTETILKDNPESLKIATLLFKPESLKIPVEPDYVAMNIPSDFIVGYGLDYEGHGRNLRDIYKLK